MSLRVRLVLVIVALVTAVSVALSILHLDSLANALSADALQRSELASQQVQSFVTDHIKQHWGEYEAPATFDETVGLWDQIVTTDPDISDMLVKTMALTPGIVEINVAEQNGKILASSNPLRLGQQITTLKQFSAWRNLPMYRRIRDLFLRRTDYQVDAPLGVGDKVIFNIQVITSSVLLRDALQPEVQWVAVVSLGALVVSLVITIIAGNWLLTPLRRIERMIDRIVQGSFRRDDKLGEPAKEFAAVESKLNLLGEKYTGVRQEASERQHGMEQLLERMESQLDVASRLAAISRITGGVAHEIKNPLNAISLHLDLLRARISHNGAEQEDSLTSEIDILSKEVRRLDRVVKTFLDFSRPVDVRLLEVDLSALVREVAELMTPQARLARIDLRFDATDGEVMEIRGDADMLKQAVLNLVTNALDAMKEGGSLRLSVRRNGESVILEVADNGPGIPHELRQKVFQLYFTTKPTGSGIGLAMTYRAVQLHNGTIDFFSENGRGTTFRLEFPAVVGHA
jgi:signal transduction histidine kinase